MTTVPTTMSDLFDGQDVAQIDEAINHHRLTSAKLKALNEWATAILVDEKIDELLDRRLKLKGAA